MRYVVAIDVGIKNLGICVWDFATTKIVFWENVTIVPSGRYIPAKNVQYVRDFVTKHQHWFHPDVLYAVLIERQMRCNMRIVEAILQTMFYDKCTVINAKCVKAHYNLSTKNYRLNKQKAIHWADEFVKANFEILGEGVSTVWSQEKKRDDLADSLLLIMYYLDTYSNEVYDGAHYGLL